MSATITMLGAAMVLAGTSHVLPVPQAAPTPPQAPAALKPITAEAANQWEALGAGRISPDGKWVAAEVRRVFGDPRLFIRSADGPERADRPLATNPQFSDQSNYLGYTITVAREEADRLREARRPVESSFGLRRLSDGQETVFESVRAWRFLKGGKFLLVHRNRPAQRQTGGSDLVVVNLEDLSQTVLGNVSEAIPNPDGTHVALQLESDSGYKGVQILNPAAGTLKTLHGGKSNLAGLTWAAKADVLAFMVGEADPKRDGDDWRILAARAATSAKPEIKTLLKTHVADFPKDWRITEFQGLRLSEDGEIAAFGIRAWPEKRTPTKESDTTNVEVWHPKDIEPMPLQSRQAEAKRRESVTCVWRIADGRFEQVGTPENPSAALFANFQRAILNDETPYESPVAVGGITYRDIWLIDIFAKNRRKIVTKTLFGASPSPNGGYFAHYRGGQWYLVDAKTGDEKNVTAPLRRSFHDPEDDGTRPERSPAGPALWLADDAGLVLFDYYDAYLVQPNTGTIRPLTSGAKDQIQYRLVNPGFSEDGIRLSDPMYFRAMNLDTKQMGVYRRETNGDGKMLLMDNVWLQGLERAKNVDRMLFRMESSVQSPDWYLTNDLFSAAKPMTRLNPQQREHTWGKTELIKFRNRRGENLHAVLTYPANYQPGRTYPMITYIYERLSEEVNRYMIPSPADAYNEQFWSQNGYFVLKPDITYTPRQPGRSAVECVVPAVEAALAKRVGIDPKKIGITGHSWGAYQTCHLMTTTKTFAAGVAGAPLTELTSMYNSFYWNAGITNQILFEGGQGRMVVPWWEDLRAYTDNSPVWNARNLAAPLLIAFGTVDGAVDWSQGQYLYNTARRMGKDVTMLVYPGENHGLARRPNQLDYARRLQHFFDVHLKGAKPEPWVTAGLPFLERPAANIAAPARP